MDQRRQIILLFKTHTSYLVPLNYEDIDYSDKTGEIFIKGTPMGIIDNDKYRDTHPPPTFMEIECIPYKEKT